jgi:hypothetical protein
MKRLQEDKETQRNGFVLVWYDFSYEVRFETDLITKSLQFMGGMPWKLVSVHYCSSSYSNSKPFMALVQFVLGREGRLRFRAHHGSHQELHYSLLSFGIPTSAAFPIQIDGSQTLEFHWNWLEQQRQQERRAAHELSQQEQLPNAAILAPRETDVLCGRGKPYQEHSGNQLLGDIVLEHDIPYRALKRGDKSDLCQQLVVLMQQRHGGRFIRRRDDDAWEVVPKEEAKEKVSQAFRNMFKKQRTIASVSEMRDGDNATPGSGMDDEDGDASMNSTIKRQRIQDRLDLLSL